MLETCLREGQSLTPRRSHAGNMAAGGRGSPPDNLF